MSKCKKASIVYGASSVLWGILGFYVSSVFAIDIIAELHTNSALFVGLDILLVLCGVSPLDTWITILVPLVSILLSMEKTLSFRIRMQMIMQMNKFLVLLLVLSGAAWVARAQKNNITSILEVLDVQTGGRRVLKEFNYLMEAPNWTRDGQWLYFNSGGLIYKIDAGGKGNARLVDTQSVSRCNNDHILPFGRQVGPLPHVSQRRPRAGRAPGQQELLSPDSRYIAFVSYRVDGH